MLLSGMIPQPPYILVRDEKAAVMVQAALHEDWSREPPVIIAEEWPENFNVNAVVVTPINVIGTEGTTSFSIVGDGQISARARTVLDAYMRLKKARGGGSVSYRDLSAATGLSRRIVTNSLKDLEECGAGINRDMHGFSLDIGTWTPDANKARAIGVEIKEW